MRTFAVTLLLSFAPVLWPGAAVRAQADAAADDRVQKAIADYESVRDDADKEAMRRRAIVWLGELDAPEVSEYLKKELRRTQATAFASNVIEAIAAVPRPGLEDEVFDVLTKARTPMAARVAAATTVAGLGERGVERVLLLAGADEKVASLEARNAAVDGLLKNRSQRAISGLVGLIEKGDDAVRLRVLRRIGSARGIGSIDDARIRLIRDGTLEMAAVAWRQLCVTGHARARSLAVDVFERIFDEPPPAVAAELIGGVVRIKDPDFYPALLRFGVQPGAAIRQALRAAAAPAAEDPDLLRWLIVSGLDADSEAKREVARLLLDKAPVEALQPLVERVRQDLQKRGKKALDGLTGLHDLLARDPNWAQDLAALAGARDTESRMLGLSMLLELRAPAAVLAAQQNLDHKAWELRSLSIRYLTVCRDATSIPLLLARYGKEEGRVAHELDQALFAHTGTRCYSKRDWQNWWRKHQVGFVLPHEETVRVAATVPAASVAGAQTRSYYDIPVVSSRIAFLIDHSGSMRAQVGTDKNYTRLHAAKDQLRRLAEELPATHHVNFIPFETVVTPLWKELRRLAKENKTELLEAIDKLPFGQGTNIYGAIEAAFGDSSVDTIYLLADGVPTVGVTDIDDIVASVQRHNRTRQIVIHGIAIGTESPLLRRLAEVTGGEYRYVR